MESDPQVEAYIALFKMPSRKESEVIGDLEKTFPQLSNEAIHEAIEIAKRARMVNTGDTYNLPNGEAAGQAAAERIRRAVPNVSKRLLGYMTLEAVKSWLY